MIERPNIKFIKSELKQGKKDNLRRIWRSLTSFKNYIVPESLQDLHELDGFPVFTLSNEDFSDAKIVSSPFFKCDIYVKKDENKPSLREYTDVLYGLNSLNRVVSYNCIYKNIVKEVKCVFIKKYQNERVSFEESLDEILKNVLLQVECYEFFNMIQGIALIDIKCISFGDVELFEYQGVDSIGYSFIKDEKKFLNDFENKICMRCKVLGEYYYARESAMEKFNATLNCVRYMICLYGSNILYKNQIKVNFSEKSLDKIGVSFCLNLDAKSLLYSRKMPEAFENFKISKQMYDEWNKYYFLADIQRIMICEEEKSEWENLIADAIYWCGEAQNEYNIDIAFFKFWTAIETLIPSSRGDKVTENVLNGSTILYFYGIVKHDVPDFKEEKKKLQILYEKRSRIVHNGSTSDIKSNDLEKISKYAVDNIINAIYWSLNGYHTEKQVKNGFQTLSARNNLSKETSKEEII